MRLAGLATSGGLAIAGLINLLPLAGVLGRPQLKTLYGLDVVSPDLEILLRHRAVLFAIVGVLLLIAIWRSETRLVALVVGAASMASFMIIAMIVSDYGDAVRRVLMADGVGLAAVATAFVGERCRAATDGTKNGPPAGEPEGRRMLGTIRRGADD